MAPAADALARAGVASRLELMELGERGASMLPQVGPLALRQFAVVAGWTVRVPAPLARLKSDAMATELRRRGWIVQAPPQVG